MFKNFFVFVVLSVLTLYFGCKENTTEPTSLNSDTLLPLALGNTWNYKVYSSSSDSTGEETWTVDSKIKIEGEEYFLIKSTGFENITFAVQNQKGGLFLSTYDPTDGFTSPFFFKYPVNDGETYQYQIPHTDSILSVTIKKLQLNINNNSYDSYGYINNNLNPFFPFMYFSKNVGLIRHKSVYYTSNGIDTSHYFIYDLQNKALNN